jgi:hypothetical protein
MIITVACDVFLSPATVLVNPVNTAGVMGSGISAEFKRFFPAIFEEYRALCDAGKFKLGRVWLARSANKRILHLPIKSHWRAAARREDIEAGVQLLASRWADWGIGSLAFPEFGDGELRWESDIRPLLESALGALPIPVYLHTYDQKLDTGRNLRRLDALLNKPPAWVNMARFWRDLRRGLSKVGGQLTSLDQQGFSAQIEVTARRTRLMITPADGGEAVVLLESQLTELWVALQSAGLLMAWQFPGALEVYTPYLIPLLDVLEYVMAVKTGITGEHGMLNALLFVPPALQAAPQRLTLTAQEG